MQFDAVTPQQFELVAVGGRLDTAFVATPPVERIAAAAQRLGINCTVQSKADGSFDFNTYDLNVDTVVDTQSFGPLTIAAAIKRPEFAQVRKLRCQAPFRESDSFAAFLALGRDGRPFVFDSGTGTKHWLNDSDWAAYRKIASTDITPLFSVDAYRADRFIGKPLPPRRWLFVDVLPFGKVGVIVAPGGTGKSWFLVQAGVSVATGIPLADAWQVGETGSVLMLLAEDDDEELHRRLDVVMGQLAMAGQFDAIAMLRENLIIKSMAGENNLMTEANVAHEVELTAYVDRLIATAKLIPNLKLIVFDPVSRFRGGDENKAQDTTRFVEALERVAQATGANILCAHHANKGSMNSDDQNQSASRGSSALTDGVRWQLNLATMTKAESTNFGIYPNERNFYLTATITKNNYAPPQPGIVLKRGTGGYLHRVALASQKDQVAHDTKSRIVRMVADEAASGRHYSKTAFAEKFGGTDRALGIGNNAVRNLLDELLAAKQCTLIKGKLATAQKVRRAPTAGRNPDTPIP
jgi:RecA-family ATPase